MAKHIRSDTFSRDPGGLALTVDRATARRFEDLARRGLDSTMQDAATVRRVARRDMRLALAAWLREAEQLEAEG